LTSERKEVATAYPPLSLRPEASSLSDLLDRLHQAPNQTVTVGDRRYSVVDTGRADALVPDDDSLAPPAELEERRRAIERVLFMADHPLGSVAYGLTALANGSPNARDRALMAGGLIDAAMMGAEPFGASVRGPVRSPPRQPALPSLPRQPIRLGELNENGQATGAGATVTEPMLGTGTKSDRRLRPPGWLGNGRTYNQARAHLLGRQLGGTGRDMRNLVTLPQNRSNWPDMGTFENALARKVRAGEVLEYMVNPLYSEGIQAPTGILQTAYGSRSAPMARFVQGTRR
jgi:hypothetical protein